MSARRNWTEAGFAALQKRRGIEPEPQTVLRRLLDGILKKIESPNLKYGPEDRLSVEIHDFMRLALEDGRFRGVWFKVPNESGAPESWLAKVRSWKKRSMGMVPGVTDFIIMWDAAPLLEDRGVIEIKRPGRLDGALSDDQRDFRDWCQWTGIPWACVNRLDTFIATLEGWGALNPQENKQ